LTLNVSEETVSLDSPPPESSPNFGDMLSRAMPDDSSEIEINNGIPLQQRAPGSQLRNGSITVSLRSQMSMNEMLIFELLFCVPPSSTSSPFANCDLYQGIIKGEVSLYH
jgi:hypothetical protein